MWEFAKEKNANIYVDVIGNILVKTDHTTDATGKKRNFR
jgi:hypothetical protein